MQITQLNKELLMPHFPFTFKEFEYKEPCYTIVRTIWQFPYAVVQGKHLKRQRQVYSHWKISVGKGHSRYRCFKCGLGLLRYKNEEEFKCKHLHGTIIHPRLWRRRLGLIQYGTDVNIDMICGCIWMQCPNEVSVIVIKTVS